MILKKKKISKKKSHVMRIFYFGLPRLINLRWIYLTNWTLLYNILKNINIFLIFIVWSEKRKIISACSANYTILTELQYEVQY